MQNNSTILCLGNNTEDTNARAKTIANNLEIIYHGLLTEVTQLNKGCYQTSVYDLSHSDIISLSEQIDELIILDQTKESYDDEHAYFKTIELAKHIKKTKKVTFLNQTLDYEISDMLKTNKSFCLLPFVQSVTWNQEYQLCCRATKSLSKFDPTISFSQDSNRNIIKEKMVKGELVPEYCSICYNVESKGMISPRISETIEWAHRLELVDIESAFSIDNPVYYEIRPSNQCNLMCRICIPEWSSLIKNENDKIHVYPTREFSYNNFDHVVLDKIQRLYVAGGEPSISTDFYQFLEKCITQNKINFEIVVNTNCVTLSQKFKQLIKEFANIKFEISIDGFEKVNQYARWPTKWEKLIDNIDYLYQNNFSISFHLVVSIYTISCLDKTVEFLSNRYPGTIIHISNVVSNDDILSGYNFPDNQLIVSKLDNIRSMTIYKNDLTIQTKIDAYYQWFNTIPYKIDKDKLTKFFEFNDRLDVSRNVKLIDYIPELAACQKYLTNHQ